MYYMSRGVVCQHSVWSLCITTLTIEYDKLQNDDNLSLSSVECSPWRIVDDCGGAFTMGAIGGGVFQVVKGFRNAPAVS